MRYGILFLFISIYPLAKAQLPSAEIEGRLSIYLPADTTSTHIGMHAGLAQDLTASRNNTFVGSLAGRRINTGRYNSTFGCSSGELMETGSENSFFGYTAGRESVSGSSNSFFGFRAGVENSKGNGNSFFGALAGRDNEESNYNSFFGYESGKNNHGLAWNPETMQDEVFGSNNSFFGYQSGYQNETGEFNTFIGQQAGYSNIGGEIVDNGEDYQFTYEGSRNTFVGNQAGYSNEVGRDNVYIGTRAGADNPDGNYNVMIGALIGRKVSGNYNVFIGGGPYIGSGAPDSIVHNRLYIGDAESTTPLIYGEFDNRKVGVNTVNPEMTLTIGGSGNDSRLLLANAGDIFFKNAAGDHKAVLTLHSDDDTYLDAFDDLKFRSGDNSSQSNPEMIIQSDGDVGVGVADPTYKLHVNGAVRGTDIICSSTSLCSDVRFKKDFKPLTDAMAKISRLQGYSHHWRTDEFTDWQFPHDRTIGFKAQDVQKIIPEVVQEMAEGYLTLDYAKMVPLLVEAIKEQQEVINDLKSTLSQRDEQFSTLLNKLTQLENHFQGN